MGRDKALVEIDGVPMGRRVITALDAAGCDPIWLAGGTPRVGVALGCTVLADPVDDGGPLAGVSAALAAAETAGRSWVVVVAVDLAAITTDVVRQLVHAIGPDLDVAVARGDRLEPAAAAWSIDARSAVESSLRTGRRAVHEVIGALRHVEVPVDPLAMRNVNTPADVAAFGDRPARLRGEPDSDRYPLGHGDT